ncbi:MAG: hypothetical protein ACXAEX_09805 [Promethearchaeota archaeon]|jgi:uncharacterized secreted protein with C-terminal beta-propeller domain
MIEQRMKRKIEYYKMTDKKNVKGFNEDDYVNSDGYRLEINERNFIYLRRKLNELNKQKSNSKINSNFSFKKFEYNTELDAKLKHRKKREGD